MPQSLFNRFLQPKNCLTESLNQLKCLTFQDLKISCEKSFGGTATAIFWKLWRLVCGLFCHNVQRRLLNIWPTKQNDYRYGSIYLHVYTNTYNMGICKYEFMWTYIYSYIYIYMYKQDGHVYTCNVSSRYCSIMQTQTQYINYNYTQYILSNHLISSHVITSAYIHLSMCNIENERAARRWHAFILILWCVG